MEIRAKARRLKMQHGDLGLILVDYLQLMSGGGNAENRQLEVSRDQPQPQDPRPRAGGADRRPQPAQPQPRVPQRQAPDAVGPEGVGVSHGGHAPAACRHECGGDDRRVAQARDERDVPVWSLDRSLRLVPATPHPRLPERRQASVHGCVWPPAGSIEATANHRFLHGSRLGADLMRSRRSRVAVPRVADRTDWRLKPMDLDEGRAARPPSRRWLRRFHASRLTTRVPMSRTSKPSRRLLDVVRDSGLDAYVRSVVALVPAAPSVSRRVAAIRSRPGGRTRAPRLPQLGEVRARLRLLVARRPDRPVPPPPLGDGRFADASESSG